MPVLTDSILRDLFLHPWSTPTEIHSRVGYSIGSVRTICTKLYNQAKIKKYSMDMKLGSEGIRFALIGHDPRFDSPSPQETLT